MTFFSAIQFSSSLRKHGLTILFLPLLLIGCAGEKQNVVLDTFLRGIENPNTVIDRTPLNPQYRYLKVEANEQPALLVLGYQDQVNGVKTDIWYSAFKEVVQIQAGRLAGTQGLDLNWTEVQLHDAPALVDFVSKKNTVLRYQRTRTVMPGYRARIEETVEMRALEEIPSDAPKVLKSGVMNPQIRWVQETALLQTNARSPYVYPVRAIYAVDTKSAEVIYGKQCLAQNYCVTWLSWPYPKSAI
jgi:hypothetical protein